MVFLAYRQGGGETSSRRILRPERWRKQRQATGGSQTEEKIHSQSRQAAPRRPAPVKTHALASRRARAEEMRPAGYITGTAKATAHSSAILRAAAIAWALHRDAGSVSARLSPLLSISPLALASAGALVSAIFQAAQHFALRTSPRP